MLFIIIQARMTSTRLPGKVLLPLCGQSVLQVMLQRLQRFKKNIIIATSNDGSEVPIVNLCQQLNVAFYQGDMDNVLARYYHSAVSFDAHDQDIIVRLTSDCPLIDPDVLQSSIDFYQQNTFDYVNTGVSSGFPRGMDCEVFSFAMLKQAYKNADSDYELEHVTPYFYQTKKQSLSLGCYYNPNQDFIDQGKYRLTLDEAEDYQVILAIYQHFNCQTDFSYYELMDFLCHNESIYQLNSHIQQK